MVACKVFFVVALVSVALVQINGKPAADGKPSSDTAWGDAFQSTLKDITKQFDEYVGKNSEFTTAAKSNMNAVADGLKAEMTALSKMIEGKADVSELTKESAKQWQTTMDTFSKNMPKDLNLKEFNEKSEQLVKFIVDHSTDLTNKAKGNLDLQKDIKDAAKKALDMVINGAQNVQKKITEEKKA